MKITYCPLLVNTQQKTPPPASSGTQCHAGVMLNGLCLSRNLVHFYTADAWHVNQRLNTASYMACAVRSQSEDNRLKMAAIAAPTT